MPDGTPSPSLLPSSVRVVMDVVPKPFRDLLVHRAFDEVALGFEGGGIGFKTVQTPEWGTNLLSMVFAEAGLGGDSLSAHSEMWDSVVVQRRPLSDRGPVRADRFHRDGGDTSRTEVLITVVIKIVSSNPDLSDNITAMPTSVSGLPEYPAGIALQSTDSAVVTVIDNMVTMHRAETSPLDNDCDTYVIRFEARRGTALFKAYRQRWPVGLLPGSGVAAAVAESRRIISKDESLNWDQKEALAAVRGLGPSDCVLAAELLCNVPIGPDDQFTESGAEEFLAALLPGDVVQAIDSVWPPAVRDAAAFALSQLGDWPQLTSSGDVAAVGRLYLQRRNHLPPSSGRTMKAFVAVMEKTPAAAAAIRFEQGAGFDAVCQSAAQWLADNVAQFNTAAQTDIYDAVARFEHNFGKSWFRRLLARDAIDKTVIRRHFAKQNPGLDARIYTSAFTDAAVAHGFAPLTAAGVQYGNSFVRRA